jgi:hypothetical protein
MTPDWLAQTWFKSELFSLIFHHSLVQTISTPYLSLFLLQGISRHFYFDFDLQIVGTIKM